MIKQPHPAAAVSAGSLAAWFLAARPKTLPAAVVPVLVGSACALGLQGFRGGPALAALFGALCIQVGANLANDLFDSEKGADTPARVGPLRMVQAGLLSPAQVRRGLIVVFGLAAGAGLYLAWQSGPVILLLGVLSILSAVVYTAGPYPLGYLGLGEVFVLLFFGFGAVCGTAYVQLGWVPPVAFWASWPVGALTTGILIVNNVRDRATDRLVGKKTLAVRLGKTGSVIEYGVLLAVAYVVPVLLALRWRSPWLLLPLLTLPLAFRLTRELQAQEGPPLNLTLAGTAKLLLAHGLLFALGLSLGLSP